MREYSQSLTKLDRVDEQLLYCLDVNARMPITAIATQLRIPESTVRHRIQSLSTRGIISTYYPVLGVGRVGMSVHKFMFKLQKASEAEFNQLVVYLCKNPLVNWVARFDGDYDLGCTLLVRNIGEVSEFLDQTRKRFHLRIRQMSYAVNIGAEFHPRDYLVRKRRTLGGSVASYTSYTESAIHLDAVDWEILRALSNDARSSAIEIAKKVGVSSETVGRRIRNLEKNGSITGYRLVLDPAALGRTSYYLLLYLSVVSEDRLTKLINHLRSNPAVVYMVKMLGEWDYDISLELQSALEHRAFMFDLMQHFSDVIRDVRTLTTWQIAKFSIFPKGSGNL